MYRLAILVALLAQGCVLFDTNEITGHWGVSADGYDGTCIPGEEIYVEVRDEEAEWFPCTAEHFSTSVSTSRHDFTLEIMLDAGGNNLDYLGMANLGLRDVTGDFDVGLVKFDRVSQFKSNIEPMTKPNVRDVTIP